MHISYDLLAIVIVILAQWHLTRRILAAARRRFSPRGAAAVRVAVFAFHALIGAAFTLGYAVSLYNLPPASCEIAGAIGQIWYFGATAGYLAWSAMCWLTGRIGRRFDPSRRRLLNTAGGALLAAPFAVAGYGAFVERLDFHVREIDIPVAALPADLDGLRLLHLSDIHLSAFLSEHDLARVIDSANQLRPHLALVTGDLITSAGDPLPACLRQIARLRTSGGIFGCMGNHEYHAGVEDETQHAAARLGIQFLRRQARLLRFGSATLNVAGVDYQRFGREYLPGAEQLIQPGAYNLMLSHNPDVFPIAVAKGFDLTLAGHTHGGQVSVEILHQSLNAARFFTPYVYGLYRDGPAAEYVTRGIGTIGVPVRFGAPPEIALLRLRKV